MSENYTLVPMDRSHLSGVAELERGGLRAAAVNAVQAAYRRGTELGK